MRYRSKVNRTIILIIFFLFLCDVAFRFARQNYNKTVTAQNQAAIDGAISKLQYLQNTTESDIGLILPLLELNNLSDSQYAQIYLLLTTLYYTSGDMNSYFENVGRALFYNEHLNNTDSTIYLYANMAKYFLEIGSEEVAYGIIKKAGEFGSFYECQNILTRIQILQVYSDYLISEKRYDEAYVAADQIIEDAKQTGSYSAMFPLIYGRAGEVIKARILLEQDKIFGAYNLACELYEKYAQADEVVSQFSAFDFYMPIFYIKTMWAINSKKYDKALEFNEKYRKYCDQFFFAVKKIRLTQRVISELPPEMRMEKTSLTLRLSGDSRALISSVFKNYTFLASDKFSTIMTQMDLEAAVHEKTQEYIHSIMLNLFIAVVIILLIYLIFAEAHTDGLTKLSTRAALNSKLIRLEFFKTNYSAIMMDLDNFKQMNDTYGHDFGDKVLKDVAGVVLDSERRHVKAYRYGGEEFIIIFEHFAFEDVIRHAESIRTKICRLQFSNGVHVSASFGVGAKPENPIKLADENLYYAKSKGKNIVAYKINNKQYLAERRLEIRNPMPDTEKK